MRLIKFFTNNNNLVSSLKVSELFFNKVGNFNDPFEGIFRFKLWSDEDKIRKFYLKHFSGNPQKVNYYIQNKGELEKEINKTFEYRQLNNAVTCFSVENNLTQILMWAHYANNHAGLCLVFEGSVFNFKAGFELFEESLKSNVLISSPTGPHRVHYEDEYINTDPLDGALNQKSFLTTKFNVWSYEDEVRFIAPKQGLYHFDSKALEMIVFGLRTPPKFKVQIRNIAIKLYPKVIFNRIKLKEDDFAFELESELFDN
jgi:hypothetical protein